MGERGKSIDIGTVCRIERLLLTGQHSIYMVAKLCDVHHLTVTKRRDQLRAAGKLAGQNDQPHVSNGDRKTVIDSRVAVDVPEMRHGERDASR